MSLLPKAERNVLLPDERKQLSDLITAEASNVLR